MNASDRATPAWTMYSADDKGGCQRVRIAKPASVSSRRRLLLSTLDCDLSTTPELPARSSALDPDVLILIFELCRDDSTAVQRSKCEANRHGSELSRQQPRPRDLLGWIACSQVCQHWRRVALDTPSLWGDIYLELGPTWMKTSADRAQSIPGIHAYGYMDKRYGEVIKSAPNSLSFSRLRSFFIDMSCTLLAPFFEILFRDKPVLRSIAIKGYLGEEDPPFVCDYRLSDFTSPAVQRISLENILVKWDPLPFIAHSLTRFEFLGPAEPTVVLDDMTGYHLTNAIKFFQNTPALEILRLHHTFTVFDDIPEFDDEVAELSHLQELDIVTEDERNCHHFISHVNFPTPRMRLYLTGPLIDEAGIASLVHRTSQYFHRELHGSEVDGTLGWYHDHTDFVWLVVHSAQLNYRRPSECKIPLSDRSSVDVALSFSPSILLQDLARVVCDALPPSFTIRTLVVDCHFYIGLWPVFVQCFPHVTTIITSDPAFIDIDAGSAGPLRFPELATLELPLQDLYLGDQHADALLHELRRRNSEGLPLQRLVVDNSFTDSGWRDAASILVRELVLRNS
ncbi:hypothetical protein BC834DRAFT_1045304 [Gloeopeniophorella convolvens]|nr:hypothetical protein BC834DRAFT_1045304 [Gloeopeniophorella convolvens]